MEMDHRTSSVFRRDFERDLIIWGETLYLACLAETGEDVSAQPEELRLRAAQTWESIRVREMAEEGTFLALPYLSAAFSLEDVQYRCLTLSLLPQMDRRFERYWKQLDPAGDGDLTLGLALWLMEGDGVLDPAVRVLLGEKSVLMRFCMEPVRRGGRSLSRALVPAERVANFVLSENWQEPDCPGLSLVHRADGEFPESILRKAEQMAAYLEQAEEESVSFLLKGRRGAGRRTLAAALARMLGGPLLMADGRCLFGSDGDRFRLSLVRECILQRCPVCVTGLEDFFETAREDLRVEEELCALLQETAAIGGCSLVLSETEWIPADPAEGWRLMPVELPVPTLEESRALWTKMLACYPEDGSADPDQLAGKYRFTPGQIRNALENAYAAARWRGAAHIDSAGLEQGCRSQLQHALGEKARKVERLFGWDDLILPASSKQLLRSACDQIRYRRQVYDDWGFAGKLPYGKGLSMLFSGPPGTGKTMAAQIAAGELGLELYKVELSAVVSKYVGETEKNLNLIFREAARSQAVLFFDEADVLFGKRTEVKDAHDKYNNMEAAYLLQKMEEYPGVSVLATNFLQNFDEAFKRRIRFVIEFPFPDAGYRRLLWQSVFPAATPLSADVDWDYLASNFELSGSAIKNTAVNAAFLAAGRGESVGMAHLLVALRRELYKSGKVLTREDFGQYYMLAEEEWDNA